MIFENESNINGYIMEQPSDHDIFNAIMILNEHKKNPVQQDESFEMVKRRVDDWNNQMKYANNLTKEEYAHLRSWRPSRHERERVERESRCPSRPKLPEEVRQAQILLTRVKLQIESVL